ncbi:hypothetical protein SAMN04488544_1219 [Microlunatus sagamiharensis]|uniref:Uncharacterized protein n=1 Tax=Microlunatus sagamiharensis TaxID=546874 RepID=A0A1H2M1N4_9ACTN|nr:hypothetical protein [Microlunatus sagamiharensis]SDU86925.1 hypothetical protein SAMN04488544_1219 [Microlunatus sagamiharensis]
MSTAVTFAFVGPAAFVRLLALRLREEGLVPGYEPPGELAVDAGSLQVVRVDFEVATAGVGTDRVVQVVRQLAARYQGRFDVQDLREHRDEDVGQE